MTQEPSQEPDNIREWSIHEAIRKQIFREAWHRWKTYLKQVGHTEDTLKELGQIACEQSQGKDIDTEFGRFIRDSTDAFLHKNSTKIGTIYKPRLITKEE